MATAGAAAGESTGMVALARVNAERGVGTQTRGSLCCAMQDYY